MPNAKGQLLEADTRDKSLRIADKACIFHKRMHFGPGTAGGWPDDLFILQYGHHWWVEFKRPGGVASPKQEAVHRRMQMYGLDVSVIDTWEKFEQELRLRLAMGR